MLVFSIGVGWGLPSRAADPYLFGDHPIWSGAQINALAGDWSGGKGSEIDANPLAHRDQPIVLNETDAQRAEIIQRYRLYSHQPDEMLTFRALAGMKPSEGKFDPRGYQYGGLWIYPVGGLLKAASMVGLVRLTADRSFYLDHPEAFGRFFIVARLYSAFWGAAGAAAVFLILRRLTDRSPPAIFGAVAYIFLPAVMNMAHEAKPHLPCAALTLWAVIFAARFVDRPTFRRAALAGATCGAAMGMAPTGLLSFAVLPIMALAAPLAWTARLKLTLLATIAGGIVFAVTNPYIPINLLRGEKVVAASAANTASFYGERSLLAGIVTTIRVIGEGATWPIAAAGAVGFASCVFPLSRYAGGGLGRGRPLGAPPPPNSPPEYRGREIEANYPPLIWILAGPVALSLIQLIWFGAGKKYEYGRFSLLTDIALLIFAITSIANFRSRRVAVGLFTLVLASTMFFGGRYLFNFVRDARSDTSRLAEAARLRQLAGDKAITIATHAEPAPYCLPPVDLFRWKLVLLPKNPTADPEPKPDVLIDAVDQPNRAGPPATGYVVLPQAAGGPVTPISWAAKPFQVQMRADSPK